MATLTAEQIYQVCVQAGFTPDQAVTWTAIALAESGGNTGAHNPVGEDSRGLWQINIDPDVRENHWGDLSDPLTNARAAYEISNGGTNMRPWTVTHASNEGTNKDYRNYMDEARAASGHTAQGDFSGVSGYDDPSGMGPDEPGPPAPAEAPPMAPPPVAPAPPPPTTGTDSDADGALDAYEMSAGTDPESPDSDDDGLTDGFELLEGSDPLQVDSDADGLSDGHEAQAGTDPGEADTDADGMDDAMELADGRDPLHGAGASPTEGEEGGGSGDGGSGGTGGAGSGGGEGEVIDSDDDGLSDRWEASLGTDPLQADTDRDDLSDALEQAAGSDPLRPDTDADGQLDGLEGGSDLPPPSTPPGLDDGLGTGDGPGPGTPLPPVSPLAGAAGGVATVAPPMAAAPPLPGAVPGAMPGAPAVPAVPPMAPMPPAAPLAVDGAGAPPGGTAQQFLDAALGQAGDPYIFGAEVDTGDVDPDSFDCSELTQWAAAQVGLELPDGSWLQYLELEEQGAVIPVEQAAQTPGALLFSFSSDPTAGGGRPSQAHVAISLGDGRTIEARGREYGVGSWEVGDRFTYAAVIPGLSGAAAPPPPDALAGLPQLPPPAPAAPLDSDHDGVTDAFEMSAGTNPLLGDSDADGLTDGFEVMTGASGTALDSDHDGLTDAYETQAGTATAVMDSDQDGLSDALEMAAGRDARYGPAIGTGGEQGGGVLDADSDGLSDAWEASLGSDAGDEDSDADGLADSLELVRGTDPGDPDSDEDGFTDSLDDD